MARKARYTDSLPVQMTPEMRARVLAVADAAEVACADVIRDCIENTLPSIELSLGLVDLEEEEETSQQPPRENRAAGCFGGPPLPPG